MITTLIATVLINSTPVTDIECECSIGYEDAEYNTDWDKINSEECKEVREEQEREE